MKQVKGNKANILFLQLSMWTACEVAFTFHWIGEEARADLPWKRLMNKI